MEMTLEDAAYCLSDKSNGCMGCKFNKQDEIDCRREALKMGEDAIKTLIKYKDDFEKIFLENNGRDSMEERCHEESIIESEPHVIQHIRDKIFEARKEMKNE